jgi:hypothetical protein
VSHNFIIFDIPIKNLLDIAVIVSYEKLRKFTKNVQQLNTLHSNMFSPPLFFQVAIEQ